MKKALYALLSIAVVGGLVFGVSQSDMLKGDFRGLDHRLSDDGGDDGEKGEEFNSLSGINYEFYPDTYVPIDIDSACKSEYSMSLYIENSDGDSVNSISSDKFEVKNLVGMDVTNLWSVKNDADEYIFDFTGSGKANSEYNVIVSPTMYDANEMIMSTNDSCSDLRRGSMMELSKSTKLK
jgi:hypothetical protein